MPFNGSGTYVATSLPGSWNPATTGSSATPADWNTLLTDLSTALSTAICKDGQTTVTADIPMATHKITGLGDPSAAQDAATKNYVDTVALPSGMIVPYVGTTAPSGWILANGLTIGDASSGGTGRANADTVNLFTALWNSWGNAQAPVSGGRGGSAASDFSAHKTITLPDMRGYLPAGLDNMGGLSSAGRLSDMGGANILPGGTGGGQRTNSMDGPSDAQSADLGSPTGSVASINHTHSNVHIIQPTMVMSYIIRL